MDSGLAPEEGAPRNDEGWSMVLRNTSDGFARAAPRSTGRGAARRLRTHPGEVLREEYLVPLGMSARALAKAIGVPANRVSEIMRGTRDVSADTAIRLGRYFGTDPRFWLNLQTAHDLSKAEKARSYRKIVPRTAA
jgi:addiction module HigA family antidote